MEKALKYILYIILGVSLISFIWTIVGNSDVRGMRKDLNEAKRSADSALVALKESKDRVESIKSDMDALKQYIAHIQKSVEANDREKILVDEHNASVVKAKKEEIAQMRRENLADSLPPIDEVPLKKP